LPEGPRLRELGAARGVLVGAALKDGLSPTAMGVAAYEAYALVAAREFDFFTPENQHKFRFVQPTPGGFTFSVADSYDAFAASAGGWLHGHPMIWYKASNLPDFVLAASTRAELLAVMEAHIDALGSRWGARMRAWDVVNEAVTDGLASPPTQWRHGLRGPDTDLWRRVIGDDYVERAFRHAALVRAREGLDYELLYNDYGAEGLGPKAHAQYLLLQDHLARGVPIDGVGLQMHLGAAGPSSADLRANLRRLSDLGLSIYITELDSETGADAAGRDAQAHLYHRMLDIALRNPHLRGVQTWGFTDRHSWLPAASGPLLFDAPASGHDFAAKPAYFALQDALSYERRDPLVADGGFESGLGEWVPVGGPALRLERLTGGAHSGSAALRVSGRVNETDGPAQDLLPRLVADGAGAGRYELAGWFRVPSGPAPVRLVLRVTDARGERRDHVVEGVAGASWRRMAGWINVAWFKQATEARLFADTVGGGVVDFDLDDVSLGDGNLLADGAMEAAAGGAWSSFGGCALARDSSAAGRHYGERGLAVANRSAAWSGPSQNVLPRLLAAGPGVYRMSGYVKPSEDGVEPKLTVRVTDEGGAHTHLVVRRPAPRDRWTRVSGEVALRWNATPTAALFYVETASGVASFSVDDLILRKVAEPAETAFAAWQALHFTEEERAGPAAGAEGDPDGDGLANLAEYALGLDPRRGDGSGVGPRLERDESGGLVIEFRRRVDAAVMVALETSEDLKNWGDFAMAPDVTPDPEPGYARWSFREAAEAAAVPRRFYRLRFTLGE
jgi:endo-1,4-beta-xylanase